MRRIFTPTSSQCQNFKSWSGNGWTFGYRYFETLRKMEYVNLNFHKKLRNQKSDFAKSQEKKKLEFQNVDLSHFSDLNLVAKKTNPSL